MPITEPAAKGTSGIRDALVADAAAAISQIDFNVGEGGVYVAGNNLDFDFLAHQAAKKLGHRLAGLASFSTQRVFNPFDKHSEPLFTLHREFVSPSTFDAPDLLFCQGYIASDREVRAMISRVLDLLEVGNIIILAPEVNSLAKSNLESYFGDDSKAPVQVFSNRIPNLTWAEAWQHQENFHRSVRETLGPRGSELPSLVRQSMHGKAKLNNDLSSTNSPKI